VVRNDANEPSRPQRGSSAGADDASRPPVNGEPRDRAASAQHQSAEPRRDEKPGLAEAIAPPPDNKPTPAMIVTSPGKTRIILLTIIAVVVIVAALKAAAVVAVPLALAVVLSIVLSPVVTWLGRLRIPAPLGAAMVVATILVVTVAGVYYLSYPAAAWMRTLPDSMREVEWKLRDIRAPIEDVTEATKQVEEATANNNDSTPVVRVREQSIADILLTRTQAFLIAAAVVIVLLYMLLASGDLFLHKLVKVHPQFSDKKVAVEVVRQIKHDVALHLFTITIINAALGGTIAVAMFLLDMPNPLLWGLMAAALNYIPYFGAFLGAVVISLVAFVTFDETAAMLLPPLTYILLTGLEGYFITPMVLGVRLSLNPVVILIGLLFWGWLWGIPGALLTVPLLVIIKSVCDRTTSTQAVGEFLGR
jgi:predicted PurR-regulated permease PerM